MAFYNLNIMYVVVFIMYGIFATFCYRVCKKLSDDLEQKQRKASLTHGQKAWLTFCIIVYYELCRRLRNNPIIRPATDDSSLTLLGNSILWRVNKTGRILLVL